MKRRNFLQSLVMLSLTGQTMKLAAEHSTNNRDEIKPMPVLFVGHGSPMNALEQNEFSHEWQIMGNTIPKPRAVLCISAHWETKGTWVTAMDKPRTIHDFHGFPDQLYNVQYPAGGSKEIAGETKDLAPDGSISLDYNWGLDHGCWSVMKHVFPKADIPVLQMSLDYSLDPSAHFQLAKQLAGLRRNGILIIGSGNMVHNLRMIDWKNQESGTSWAEEAQAKMKQIIDRNAFNELFNYNSLGRDMQLAIPTPEHFLPLIYALALKDPHEKITYFNDKRVMGSISMTSIKIN
jgi:4,5-DOPA dioxygenase extradiol